MWESTGVASCRIKSWKKLKALTNIIESNQQKWLSGPKSVQQTVWHSPLSRYWAKEEHPKKGILYRFYQYGNHDLSRWRTPSQVGTPLGNSHGGRKPDAPWGSQKCFVTCQEPNHSAQYDLIITGCKQTRLQLFKTTVLWICFSSQSTKKHPTVFLTLIMTLASEFTYKSSRLYGHLPEG